MLRSSVAKAYHISTRWGWQSTGNSPSLRNCQGSALVIEATRHKPHPECFSSIAPSQNRVLTQCSGSIYDPHLDNVTGGLCQHCNLRATSSSSFANERLKDNALFHPRNYDRTKFLGEWLCVRAYLGPTSDRKLV